MGQVCSGSSEEPTKRSLLDVPSQGDDIAANGDPSSGLASGSGNQTGSNNPAGGGGGASSSSSAINNNDDDDDGSSPMPEAATTLARQAAAELADAEERRKRRELWIVNGAARGMVAVRSTRGSTGYYDQGFAGLLAQHLEQTTSFPDTLPLVLPPPPAASSAVQQEPAAATAEAAGGAASSPAKAAPATTTTTTTGTVYDHLAAPPWEGMDLVVNSANGKANANANANDATTELQGREAAAAQSGDPHQLMDALAESLLEGPYTVIPGKQQLFAGVRPMVENLL
eukprot:jgi/Psemu1/296002/fgenesh1_pm.112_\